MSGHRSEILHPTPQSCAHFCLNQKLCTALQKTTSDQAYYPLAMTFEGVLSGHFFS
jgi:hypothetical protein